jgi:leader peptidase (prepilin peptidase)/N-methyltransferase
VEKYMETSELAVILAPLGILAFNIPSDIRRRKIYPMLTLVGAVTGLAVRAVLLYPERGGAGTALSVLLSLLPGALLILLARLTEEKVGYGDGIMLLMLGSWTGAAEASVSFLIALFYAAIVGAASGKKEVPFVPYLAAGFLTVMAVRLL